MAFDWPSLSHYAQMAHFKRKYFGDDHLPFTPRAIVVYAQWVPLAADDVCDMTWFDRIRDAGSSWLKSGHFASVKVSGFL